MTRFIDPSVIPVVHFAVIDLTHARTIVPRAVVPRDDLPLLPDTADKMMADGC